MSAVESLVVGPESPAAPSSGAGRSWRVGRFLLSELRVIAGRRRNIAGLGVLAVVPIIIAIAVRVSADDSAGGPTFVNAITGNGLFVALAALTVELPLFLPLAIAAVSGDAVAGEANLGTLRYLLTIPVGRTRLLLVKYLSLVISAVFATALVAVVGGLIGIALFVSTLTEQPIGAMIAVVLVNVMMYALDSIPQLSWLHPWLLVHWATAFGDLLRTPMFTENVSRGLLVAL